MAAYDIIVIGAGPYGLATGSHLAKIPGLSFRVFGDLMSFWRNQMPSGMMLRSMWGASHLWDPEEAYQLDAYTKTIGVDKTALVPLERFVGYCEWFQKQAVPDLDRRKIARVEQDANGFNVHVEDGEIVKARRVVVAGGILPFARRLPVLANLPRELTSHTADCKDVAQYKGKKVVMIGAGQSALETAALLHEAGAEVEIIARQPEVRWLKLMHKLNHNGGLGSLLYSWTEVGPAGMSRLVSWPHVHRLFPQNIMEYMRKRSIRSAGSAWLRPRVEGKIPITTGRYIASAQQTGDRAKIKLDDGSERVVDHVMTGTGFQIDIKKYAFLDPKLAQSVAQANGGGFPLLKRGFESSIPGLHFVGAPAAYSFSPILHFVAGTKFATHELASHIQRHPKPAGR